MAAAMILAERAVIAVEGAERFTFLQGLVTQDMRLLESGEQALLYSALLSAQGKILFDFFLHQRAEAVLIDIAACWAEEALTLLKRYRLRAKISMTLSDESLVVSELEGNVACHAEWMMANDPRDALMGMRGIVTAAQAKEAGLVAADAAYWQHQLQLGIPDSRDFDREKAYIAEYGLDQLNAVSFTKGCYVGQEIVARMKHRAKLRKFLHQLRTQNGHDMPEIGAPVMAGEKEIGTLLAVHRGEGLAILNRDKLRGNEQDVTVKGQKIQPPLMPRWFTLPPADSI